MNDDLIIQMRDVDKKTFREIGEALGFSRHVAMDNYRKAVHRREYNRKYKNKWWFGMSSRAANILNNCGIVTPSDLRREIKAKRFAVGRVRGLGVGIFSEIVKLAERSK